MIKVIQPGLFTTIQDGGRHGYRNIGIPTSGFMDEESAWAANKIVEKSHDFIFAIGDDSTDEYLFEELPERTFTIKVGSKNTVAKYNISSIKKVHEMIKNFI